MIHKTISFTGDENLAVVRVAEELNFIGDGISEYDSAYWVLESELGCDSPAVNMPIYHMKYYNTTRNISKIDAISYFNTTMNETMYENVTVYYPEIYVDNYTIATYQIPVKN